LRFTFLLLALLTLIFTGYTGLFLIVILYYVYAALVAGWWSADQRPGE